MDFCFKPHVTQNQQKNGRQEEDESDRRKGEQNLELNHTHYLMMDDGTRYNYDMGNLRTELCWYLKENFSIKTSKITANTQLHHSNCTYLVPTVTMLVEGGKGTLKSIYYDLKRGIPVLVVEVTL